MTHRPKSQQDEHGHWRQNGARAKAGLNKSILASAWAQTKTCTEYKALRQRKLCIVVPPQYSSQTCSQCDYTDSGNRPSQAVFACQSCGYRANADDNASDVLKHRGVDLLLSGGYAPPKRKRTMRFRSKVGTERSEPSPIGRLRRRRLKQDAERGTCFVHGSAKLETPATTALAA